MNRADLRSFKGLLKRLWVLSPERLWLLSTRLQRRGNWRAAFALKQLNSLLYHNSLAPGASVSADISLGHNSLGIVIHSDVEIGYDVTIWHNVTLVAGRLPRRPPGEQASNGVAAAPAERSRIVVGDHVTIGANAVLIAPRGRTLRIGNGARIGAGTVVTEDVPKRTTVVGAPLRTFPRPRDRGDGAAGGGPGGSESPGVEHSG
jgi:serine O-acetyltransferase